jgi:hypothetical protein
MTMIMMMIIMTMMKKITIKKYAKELNQRKM